MDNLRTGNTILDLVGATPMVRLNRVGHLGGAQIWAKLEFFNPAGSVKDRTALAMIELAESQGLLKPGMTIIESTSGNTGIGLAMVAAVKGYRLVITMPEGVSDERTKLLKAFGAEVVLTSAYEGMRGTIEKAQSLKDEYGACFMPKQFENPANPEIHRQTTAKEIIKQMEVGVEPQDSAVLSGGPPGPTEIDGLGAGMIPPILNREILDRVITVSNGEARQMARRLAKEEGVLAGISSGANVHAAAEVAKEMNPDQRVVTILCDTGERYLGTFLFG
jgi:cysteine synthase A